MEGQIHNSPSPAALLAKELRGEVLTPEEMAILTALRSCGVGERTPPKSTSTNQKRPHDFPTFAEKSIPKGDRG